MNKLQPVSVKGKKNKHLLEGTTIHTAAYCVRFGVQRGLPIYFHFILSTLSTTSTM